MFSNVFQCYLLSFSLSLTISLSRYLTLSHSHTLSISHWITLDMLNNFCFHLYAQNSLSHSHTLSISHTITLDMLNNFCFHVYAQNSLFIGENCNEFFGTSPSPVSLEFIELVPSYKKPQQSIVPANLVCHWVFPIPSWALTVPHTRWSQPAAEPDCSDHPIRSSETYEIIITLAAPKSFQQMYQ